jgi:hypothetical protein
VGVNYADFLAGKQRAERPVGPALNGDRPNSLLHDWQRAIVSWCVRRGRAALWVDTGMGKGLMQVEWLRLVTGQGAGLIVAPLAVAQQTVREAEQKLGVSIDYVREQPKGCGLYATNYEMLDHFDPRHFKAVVFDESSRIKEHTTKTAQRLIADWSGVPYVLAASATPAPNDATEIATHAALITNVTRAEMLATYFVHDDSGWRLKGHAVQEMWKWVSTWAVAASMPSDLGDYSDEGYVLPPLRIHEQVVESDVESPGQLFATDLGGVGGRAAVRRQTLEARVERAAALANGTDDQWLLWCGQNAESTAITSAVRGAVEITGSMPVQQKVDRLMEWLDGKHRCLVTKPSIAAHGVNAQQCHRMAFVGLGDSFEQYYQAIRRCYRYGQTEPVDVHIVVSDLERQVVDNVRTKEAQDRARVAHLVRFSREELATCESMSMPRN